MLITPFDDQHVFTFLSNSLEANNSDAMHFPRHTMSFSHVLNIVLIVSNVFDEYLFARIFRAEHTDHEHGIACTKKDSDSLARTE